MAVPARVTPVIRRRRRSSRLDGTDSDARNFMWDNVVYSSTTPPDDKMAATKTFTVYDFVDHSKQGYDIFMEYTIGADAATKRMLRVHRLLYTEGSSPVWIFTTTVTQVAPGSTAVLGKTTQLRAEPAGSLTAAIVQLYMGATLVRLGRCKKSEGTDDWTDGSVQWTMPGSMNRF